MSEHISLTEANFQLYAAKYYDNVFYDVIEFQEDLKRFAYIKRLFNSYRKTGDLKERLILNHIIVIYNMWPNIATSMLFLKLRGYEDILKSILIYMERMPDVIIGIGLEKRTILSKDIVGDEYVIGALRSLDK